MKPALAFLLAAGLAACTVGPDYKAPGIDLVSRFAEGDGSSCLLYTSDAADEL